jgi:hypothetical protein
MAELSCLVWGLKADDCGGLGGEVSWTLTASWSKSAITHWRRWPLPLELMANGARGGAHRLTATLDRVTTLTRWRWPLCGASGFVCGDDGWWRGSALKRAGQSHRCRCQRRWTSVLGRLRARYPVRGSEPPRMPASAAPAPRSPPLRRPRPAPSPRWYDTGTLYSTRHRSSYRRPARMPPARGRTSRPPPHRAPC